MPNMLDTETDTNEPADRRSPKQRAHDAAAKLVESHDHRSPLGEFFAAMRDELARQLEFDGKRAETSAAIVRGEAKINQRAEIAEAKAGNATIVEPADWTRE